MNFLLLYLFISSGVIFYNPLDRRKKRSFKIDESCLLRTQFKIKRSYCAWGLVDGDRGFGFGSIQNPLLLEGLVVNGYYNSPSFTNIEGISKTPSHFLLILDQDLVRPFIVWNELLLERHIPSDHSYVPHHCHPGLIKHTPKPTRKN